MNREHRGENIEKEVFTQIKEAKKNYCTINGRVQLWKIVLKGL